MKSYRKILASYEKEIIAETAKNGYWAGQRLASELAGIKGYGFSKWLKEVTGSENFGLHPRNPLSVRSKREIILRNLEQAILERFTCLDVMDGKRREIEQLDQDIRLLQWKLAQALKGTTPVLVEAENSYWRVKKYG